jgi:hypothetical protein
MLECGMSLASWSMLVTVVHNQFTRIYKNNPRSIEALQNEITRVIGSIAMDEHQKVSHNLFMWLEACLQTEGGHFQHLL